MTSLTRQRQTAIKFSLKSRIALIVTGILLCSFILWQASHWSRQIALDQIGQHSHNTLNLIAENIAGDLGKYRHLPQLLATTQEFYSLLKGSASIEEKQYINEKLERIKLVTGALETYLIDINGLVVAASNWGYEDTFIGRDLSNKPYFKATLEGRLGRHFAIDASTGERSYYFAYPVRDQNRIIGASVVKIDIQHHEDEWLSLDHETIVVDSYGIIFLSSQPDWQQRSLSHLLPETIDDIERSQRYSNQPLDPLTLTGRNKTFQTGASVKIDYIDPVGNRKKEMFLIKEHLMGPTGWKVMLLVRTKQIDALVRVTVLSVAGVIASLFLAAVVIYQRRRRLSDYISAQEQANSQLEMRVHKRTNALTKANRELQGEIIDRKRAEEELRKTQATLVQTAKLAALGQMSAGLSHELNQPLTAIRSYAHNAKTFFDRNQGETAKKNLNDITELTERMARIIQNLRTYARDETIRLQPTSLCSAINESLVLMDRRIREEGVTVYWEGNDREILVLGGDVRLQQIFVNLISNAIDAVTGSHKKEIHINVAEEPEQTAVITVQDTGHGIPEDQMTQIFDPFYSTKEVGKGTGLGLSITFGLVKQFGGLIEVTNASDGGAIFRLKLKLVYNT